MERSGVKDVVVHLKSFVKDAGAVHGHSMGFDQIHFNGTLLPFTGAYSGGWQSKAGSFLCPFQLLIFDQNKKCLC